MNSSFAISPVTPARTVESQDAILPWLHHLSQLFPITQALVIGAGNGTDLWTSFLRDAAIESVTLVEADEACFHHLQQTTKDQKTWALCHQLIAPERGPTIFHKTSVPCENGLLPPEKMQGLWPRISSREAISLDAIRLADVMVNLPFPTDWLFIDCLPADILLESAADHLSGVTVVVARATAEPSSAGAAKANLATSMDAHGFQLLAFQPNRNPKTGHALFIRKPGVAERKTIYSLYADIRSLQEKLTQAESQCANLSTLNETLQAKASENESPNSSGFYNELAKKRSKKGTIPFVLLDSKSLPRSGIHYLKSRLQHLLGGHFSFCEWYNETGCCRLQPCGLTSYANYAAKTAKPRVRLIKSHDFKLTDPVIDTGLHLQRVVIARDPIFTLTSWFEMEQFGVYKKHLAQAGIDITKIWLAHEPEVIDEALAIVDHEFQGYSPEALDLWLSSKAEYMIKFIQKWIHPQLINPLEHVHLIRYEEIDEFAFRIIEPFRSLLPTDLRIRFDKEKSCPKGRFTKRSDPFEVKSKSISRFIQKHSEQFLVAASNVLISDNAGYFKQKPPSRKRSVSKKSNTKK